MRSKSHRWPNMGSPQFARHFPSLHQENQSDFNVHMFVEDIQLAIMPIGGRSSKSPEFAVEIQGKSEQAELVTALLQSLASHDQYHLEELLSDAVGEVARCLTWEGLAAYEIIYDNDNGTYFLHNFTSQRLFHIFRKYVQVIPKKDRDLWNKSCVVVSDKDIWKMSIPRVLGGRRNYRSIFKGLTRFQHLGPKFWKNDLKLQNYLAYFDYQYYSRNADIYCLKITNRWGWNRRDFSLNNWTEYYLFYKILQFAWAQAIIREHIVDELNKLLRRLSIEAKIIMKGLPSAKNISIIREQLRKGQVSFNEAYDVCSL